jgi:hypothetical protein
MLNIVSPSVTPNFALERIVYAMLSLSLSLLYKGLLL